MMPHGIGLPADGVPNQGWKLYITSLVMVISAGLTVVGRCATRIQTHQWGPDDYVIVCSLAFSIVLSVAIQLAVSNGYGMHKADLPRQELLTALRWFYVAQTPYKVVVGLNKVSAIIFFQRIFVGKSFRLTCWACMSVIVAWNVGAIAATIWQCVPIAGFWDKSIEATCIDSSVFWTAYAVGNILTDAMVIVLPIPQVLRLQLRLREKVMLCGVFLLGGVVVIAGILRTTAVHNSLRNQQDITYNFIPRGIWTLIESNLGIISACLPILKKPFNSLLSKTVGTIRTSHGSRTTYTAERTRQSNTVPGSSNGTDKSWPGSGTETAGHAPAWDTRPRQDSDGDVELLDYDVKAANGIVRKDSWTVTVDADASKRSTESRAHTDPGSHKAMFV